MPMMNYSRSEPRLHVCFFHYLGQASPDEVYSGRRTEKLKPMLSGSYIHLH